MRRVMIPVLLVMVWPIAAWANGFGLTNRYGTISISDSGIISKGSELTGYNGIVPPVGHSLGSVSFRTGTLTSGSIRNGGTFSSTGSSFVVIGKGNYGQPKGVIFNGAFIGVISWTLISEIGQKLEYELTGNIKGQNHLGRTVTGTTSQEIVSTLGQLGKGIGHIKLGKTQRNTPEPGTLGLLGTGLLGIVRMFRRKTQVEKSLT